MEKALGSHIWRAPVGNALCATRALSKLSQEELARRSSVHRPMISRIENGRADPQWTTVCRLFRALGYELELAPLPAQDERTGAGAGDATLVVARAQRVRPDVTVSAHLAITK